MSLLTAAAQVRTHRLQNILAPTAPDPSLYLVLRARLEKYGDDVYCAGVL